MALPRTEQFKRTLQRTALKKGKKEIKYKKGYPDDAGISSFKGPSLLA
jgi:hypothetical protein